MDAGVGTVVLKVGAAAVVPLVKKLFRAEAPGAELAERPVRIASLVSFSGERRTVARREAEKVARELVDRAARAAGPYEQPAPGEHEAVAYALTDTLAGLGDLTMDDVQAVRLGPEALAGELRARRRPELSRDGTLFHDRLLRLACVHIVDHFTRRSAFVPRTLVEQCRQHDRILRMLEALADGAAARRTEDAEFEERYRQHIVRRHGRLTIFGIDVDDEWPLDDAYLSLETSETPGGAGAGSSSGPGAADAFPAAFQATGFAGDGQPDRAAPPRRAEQALSGLDRVLLRGVAGAGKTTLLQWLAVTTAEYRPSGRLAHLFGRVPFVLPLRTLTRAGSELPAPAAFLSAVGCPHTPPPGWAERVLAAGRALLLVDGIDEVPEERRDATRRWLRELVREFPDTVCVVTARPSAVRADWLAADGFHDLSLAPMSRADVTAFIQRWHRAAEAGEDRADALLAAVRGRQDLRRLATNPLMCGLLCALHRTSHGYLPRGREEVYEAALRMLLERRDRQRGIEHGAVLDARSQTVLLERLAYWLLCNGQSQMERADALDLIAQTLPAMHREASAESAENVYRHLLDRSGLLREPAEGIVDFVHRTFQDYLAARAAVENRDFGLLGRHAHLDQWEDVVRMAVAHGRPDERKRLLDRLLKRGDTVRKHRVRLHLLATACLEHAPHLDPATRSAVEQRAAALIPPRTYQEANALAAIGDVVLELLPGAVELGDEEAEAVVHVANGLGSDAALSTLAEFHSHPSYEVRAALLSNWRAFDPDRFTAEILALLPAEDKRPLIVHDKADLAALRGLSAYPYVALGGAFSREELVGSLGKRLRHLSLRGERLTDLDFLRDFRQLESLALIEGPALTDLAALSDLPLRRLLLRKLPGLRDLGSLGALRELDYLYVGDGTPCPGLDVLPAQSPLTDLGIATTITDLTGIGTWPGLTTLRLLRHSEDLPTPESLVAIARLPVLNELVIPVRLLRALREHHVSLPEVTKVHLLHIGNADDLAEISAVLPGLRKVLLSGGSAEVDLTPLGDLEALRLVHPQSGFRVLNTDRLTRGTVKLPPESRY